MTFPDSVSGNGQDDRFRMDTLYGSVGQKN